MDCNPIRPSMLLCPQCALACAVEGDVLVHSLAPASYSLFMLRIPIAFASHGCALCIKLFRQQVCSVLSNFPRLLSLRPRLLPTPLAPVRTSAVAMAHWLLPSWSCALPATPPPLHPHRDAVSTVSLRERGKGLMGKGISKSVGDGGRESKS